MAAVRASASAPGPASFWAPRWVVAAAGACLLFFGVWSGAHLLRSRLAPSPFTASASVKLTGKWPSCPRLCSLRLANEWEALNIDLHRTADFLLASIP